MKTAAIAIRQISRRTGAVRNVVEQARYLKTMGYIVTILAEKKSDDILKESGAKFHKVWRWPFKGLYRRKWYKKSVEKWQKNNPVDIFISHGECHSPDLLVMHNCVRLYHEITGDKLSDVAMLHDEVLSKGHYRRLVVNSQLMKHDFVERYKVPEEKVDIFYQGIDTKTFNVNSHDRLRIEGRKILGVDQNAVVIGLIASGNLENRNAEFFLKFANRLSEEFCENVRFVIVGSSRPEKYIDIAESYGISEVCRFLPPLPQVEKVFHALDLHVFPAKLETFGRAVMEGLACGVPSLISDSVGATELMISDDVPYVLNIKDLDSWVESAAVLLNDDLKRSEISKRASDFAKKYSMARQFHEMEKIIRDL